MHQESKDALEDEYDFSGGVRGKHYEAFRKGTKTRRQHGESVKNCERERSKWCFGVAKGDRT